MGDSTGDSVCSMEARPAGRGMHLRLVADRGAGAAGHGFTSRDLIALTCWMQQADAHGYRRVVVEAGTAHGAPEDAGYVLVYLPRAQWAQWGIARSGEMVVVWHCGTGADLGRYPTMLQALESLPGVLDQGDRALRPPRWQPAAATLPAMQPHTVQRRFVVVHPG